MPIDLAQGEASRLKTKNRWQKLHSFPTHHAEPKKSLAAQCQTQHFDS
jgi:hypothetical protein